MSKQNIFTIMHIVLARHHSQWNTFIYLFISYFHFFIFKFIGDLSYLDSFCSVLCFNSDGLMIITIPIDDVALLWVRWWMAIKTTPCDKIDCHKIYGSNCTVNNSGNLFINGARPYAFYRTLISLSLTRNKKQ
jgi:hypothetical protein